ncbi:glycosyltransferase family 2 protein [Chamaesiphon polymorphus]|uniref:Glycosyltransferase family 2 protein n=1 Tax=Chamaesiphon polymorphus CCALA 037 TaxID=2107692 RepID=A0A2T1GIX2_9CYAN|nr:glycosyltransferase family 2 protein [Chamaesiphon polymorphus]PSB57681.1 glycosyltransferase family 2 protein [Chamaesiphon polymorphus CCALA 037]
MKVAIVTPYFQESIEKLDRCHQSVLNQNYRSTHFLVSDGFPNPELDEWNCEHIKLSKSHQDNGNTPRTVGAISALNQGFDAIAFLDADNWFDPQHIELVLKVQQQENYDVVFARRFIVSLDGCVLPHEDLEDTQNSHADTSCFTIFASAAFLLPMWAMMPKYTSPMCDRILFFLVKNNNLRYGWTDKQTVYFESHYGLHYLNAGLPIPPSVHDPDLKKIVKSWSVEDFFHRMHVKLHIINFIRYFRGKS